MICTLVVREQSRSGLIISKLCCFPAIFFYYNARLDRLECRCQSHMLAVSPDAADWKAISSAEAAVVQVHQS